MDVMISIQPYWVFLIIAKSMGWNVRREKKVEVRKNFPKNKSWSKITKIYCTKNKESFAKIPKEYQPFMEKFLGKVVGEFVCDAIISHCEMANADIAEQQGCIKREWLLEYAGDKELYGWHISDLVIYDKPKDLSCFRKPCENELYCEECGMYREHENKCGNEALVMYRAPQSWCYAEVMA